MSVMDIGFIRRKSHKGTDVAVFRRQARNSRAEIAIEFLNKWGMVAAEPDGEDSAGRQKLKLATPDEMVKRACDSADKLVAEFEECVWLLDLPAPTIYHK